MPHFHRLGNTNENPRKGNSISDLFQGVLSKLGKHRVSRWGAYSVAIGIVSGLMACAVYYLLDWGTYFALEYAAGYQIVRPAGSKTLSR